MPQLIALAALVGMIAGGCRVARDPNAPISTPDEDRVRIRASRELECAQPEIDVTQMGRREFVATGCGKQLTYRISCTSSSQNPHEHCSAVPAAPAESDGNQIQQ